MVVGSIPTFGVVFLLIHYFDVHDFDTDTATKSYDYYYTCTSRIDLLTFYCLHVHVLVEFLESTAYHFDLATKHFISYTTSLSSIDYFEVQK